MLASKHDSLDNVKYLLKQQASLEEKSLNGETALLLSVRRHISPEISKLLVEAGADINQR